MKKFLMPFFMTLMVMAVAGCADDSNGSGSPSSSGPGYNVEIPLELGVLSLTDYSSNITIKNPRTDEAQTYYPILISPAMGMNGEIDASVFGQGIVKGVAYDVSFKSINSLSRYQLTFGRHTDDAGNQMYDLTNATPIPANGSGEYNVKISAWQAKDGILPTEGEFVFAFLTEEEAKLHLPDNTNIKATFSNTGFETSYLNEETVKALNELGALKRYKWVSTSN